MRRLLLILILFSTSINAKPKIALVLSGGGARGFTQIGVLKVLEENNIKPDYIVGTSIGAIIGACYSAGYSADEIDSIARNTDWEYIFSLDIENDRDNLFRDQKLIQDRNLLRLRFENFKLKIPEGVSYGDRLSEFIQDLFWRSPYQSWGNFSDLKYPFTAVATDLVSGKSVSLNKGNLIQSVKASATIPLRYTPIKIDSMILVDGGIRANLPVEAAKNYDPDIIIAVNSTSPFIDREDLDKPWNVADQVVNILIKDAVVENSHQAQINIEPEIGDILNTDFDKVEKLIYAGRKATLMQLSNIFQLVRNDEYIEDKSSISADKISRIEIQGSSADFVNELNYYLNSNFMGRDITENNLSKIELKIKDLYKINKYNFASIDRVERQKNTFYIYVNDGIIHKISINTKSNKFLIERDLFLKEGEILDGDKLSKSFNRISNSGYFRDVSFDLIKNDSNQIEIQINATELTPQNIFLGFKLDNERNTRLGLDFLNNNLFGYGNRAVLRVSGGNRDINTELILENPRIGNSLVSLSLKGYFNKRDIFQYDFDPDVNSIRRYAKIISNEIVEERVGFSFSGGFSINRLGDFIARYKFEKQRYYNIDNSSLPDFYNLSTISLGNYLDTEDDKYFPTKGYYARTSFETNLFSDPEAIFSKWDLEYRATKSFGRHAFTPSIVFGLADITLPLPEQFNFGGQNNFFGFREYENRGRQIFRSSLNYRYQSPIDIFFKTYFMIRYDLGSAWDEPEKIKFQSLRHGVGFSTLFDTPIGPANFSIGKSFYFIDANTNVVFGPTLAYFSIGKTL